jgi:hypothetical protein
MMNYSIYLRFQDDAIAPLELRNTYIAFCVIGLAVYAFVAGPMFYYAFKYGPSKKSRSAKLRVGLVSMYFASTFPLFIMELYMIYTNGAILNVLDGMCFVLLLISWATNSIVVWFIYMWMVARFLHSHTGADREVMIAPPAKKEPYLSYARTVPGQPPVV